MAQPNGCPGTIYATLFTILILCAGFLLLPGFLAEVRPTAHARSIGGRAGPPMRVLLM